MGVGLGELSSNGGRMWGLAEGSGGVLGPPACSFVLGLTSGVGERASLASITVSLLIGVAADVGVGRTVGEGVLARPFVVGVWMVDGSGVSLEVLWVVRTSLAFACPSLLTPFPPLFPAVATALGLASSTIETTAGSGAVRSVFVGVVGLVDEAGVGVQGAMSAFIAGVGTRCVVSLTSEVTEGVGGGRTSLGGVTGPPDGGGARLGLATGNGGSLDALGRPFTLCLASQMGGHASFVWGTVSPVIEAAAGSAVVGVSWGDACACAGLAVGEGAGWGFAPGDGSSHHPFGHPFAVGERVLLALGVTPLAVGLACVGASRSDVCACGGLVIGEGSGGGAWPLSDRRDDASFASFGSMLVSPLLTFVCFLSFPLSCSFLSSFSILSSCSVPLTPLCSCCWLLVSCVTRCARLASRASRRVLTVANVVSI
jgi:hypothetical protein